MPDVTPSASDTWRSAPLKPSISAPVQVVSQSLGQPLSRPLSRANGIGEWRSAPLKPAVTAPVQVVAQAWGPSDRRVSPFDAASADVWRSAPLKPPITAAVAPVALSLTAGNEQTDAPAPGPQFQLALKEADYVEAMSADEVSVRAGVAPSLAPLDNQAIYPIIRAVAQADSGEAGYAAVSTNREYETADHPAYGQRQFGLAFGLVLFTQESGRLGSVLRLMRRRDEQAFTELFGPDADALLAVTTAPTPQERLAPVAGQPLWSQTWVDRFRAAGQHPACQAAQNEEAIEGQFRPLLRLALGLGLTTDRALAMVYDRVVTRGLGGGLRWVAEAVGILTTQSQRDASLKLLDVADVRTFQEALGLSPANGVLTPQTYAVLLGVLRDRDLVPLPTVEELMDRLVRAASGPARERLTRLRHAADFADAVFSR